MHRNRFTSQGRISQPQPPQPEQETGPQGSVSKSTWWNSESPLALDAPSLMLGTLNTMKISFTAKRRTRRNGEQKRLSANGDRLWGFPFVLPTILIVWLLLAQTSEVDAASAIAASLERRMAIVDSSAASSGTSTGKTQQLFRKAPELTVVTVTADDREIVLVRRRNRNLGISRARLRRREVQKYIQRHQVYEPLDDENDDSDESNTAKTLVISSKPPSNSTDVVQTNHLAAAGHGVTPLNATVTTTSTGNAAAVHVPSISLTTASPVTPIPVATKKVTLATLAPRTTPIVAAAPRSSPAMTTLRPATEKPDTDTPETAMAKNEDDLYDRDFSRPRPDRSSSNVTARVNSWPVLAMLLGLAAMIFTAWQMSDNPDGVFASLCRLIITCLSLVYRVVTSPCRKCLPCCFSPHHHHVGNGYHEPYGHMRVSTMDYGYKDPTLELS
jgi:hypothetical protein